MKKIFLYIALFAGMFSVQSCLHEEEEVFDTPAAQRIEDVVKADKALLESATNGWKFEYYYGYEYENGGVNFLVKFKDGKVTATGETTVLLEYEPGTTSSSSYDVVTDLGPVLSFNTYNDILHELAQPYQSAVDGLYGDYEFIIQKTTNDSIYLKGKKWGNKVLMTRLADDVNWADYMTSVINTSYDVLTDYSGTINGQKATAGLDVDYNWFFAEVGDEYVEMPYIYTSTGVKLREPVTIAGKEIQYLNYDSSTRLLTAEGDPSVSFTAQTPEGWLPFDFFAGSYNFRYNSGTFPVTLVPDKPHQRYLMRGFNEKYDVVLNYSRANGTLEWCSQQLGVDDDGLAVWLCAWAIGDGGSLTWSTDAGAYLVWNKDETNPVFTFTDNGKYSSTFHTDSFIFWGLSGGSSAGAYANPDWYAFGVNGYRMSYIKSLTKTGN